MGDNYGYLNEEYYKHYRAKNYYKGLIEPTEAITAILAGDDLLAGVDLGEKMKDVTGYGVCLDKREAEIQRGMFKMVTKIGNGDDVVEF